MSSKPKTPKGPVENPDAQSPRSGLGWAVVATLYLCVFGSMLLVTNGLPYGIDNNESFSSLWHARHLYGTPLRLTSGLADEVFAWHSAASPYVHTHQGNFPRLFAFLLYLLGARSIESQIVITTLTIGFATIWLAYRFLRTLGPPLLATVGCIVLITDYGLFGQWNVDTYRVWYGFFFFGSLFWVSELDRRRTVAMTAVGIAGFTAMFYGEYVFAAFTGVLAGLYAVVLYHRTLRTLARAWLVIAAGGAAAAVVLAIQLASYMGWKNVKLDFAYTLAARNMASDPTFTAKVDKFYQTQKIIFWHNYYDTSSVRTVSAFLGSFWSEHVQFYGSWIGLSAIVLLAGLFLGTFSSDRFQSKRSADSLTVVSAGRFLIYSLLPAILSLIVSYLVITRVRPFFGGDISKTWTLATGISPPEWLGWLCFVLSTILAATIAFTGTRRLVGFSLTRVLCVSVCALLAYAIVYRVFTGYVYSGYLNRQAPFLVFWTDSLLAVAVFGVIQVTWRTLKNAVERDSPAILGIAGLVLLASFGLGWISLQFVYLSAVPPNGEPFIKSFAKAPFRGRSFVVNNYPAPEAEKTHSWAYAESSIFSGRITLGADGYSIERDKQYLWFADGATNRDYLKPDYGLLIKHSASLAQSLDWYNAEERPLGSVGLDTVGLVRRATEPLQFLFEDKLVSTDGKNFSVVRFDWDFPPFLRPVDSAMRLAAKTMGFDQRSAVSEAATDQKRRWRVEIAPVFSAVTGEGRNAPVELLNAEIDHTRLFTDKQLADSGWSKQPDGRWIGRPGHSSLIATVAVGDVLSIHLLDGPREGTASVSVNDASQTLDLRSAVVRDRAILMGALLKEHFTSIPNFAPGMYVNTWTKASPVSSQAAVEYAYAQQEGLPEQNSTIRLYHKLSPVAWEIADTITLLGESRTPFRLSEYKAANPATVAEYNRVAGLGDSRTYQEWLTEHIKAHPEAARGAGILNGQLLPQDAVKLSGPDSRLLCIPLPPDASGQFQISVTPGTRTKSGPEYFGLPFTVPSARTAGSFAPVQVELPTASRKKDYPYGYLKMRIRFPINETGQAEPLVTTGVEEAADVLYAIYVDSTHIRIGFDHWFKGGPVTAPILIDYAKEHEIEVSMGSLYPPTDAIVFVGMDPALVRSLKNDLKVSLDGDFVINAHSDFWDSTPLQVQVGKNGVGASTCNSAFSGVILESKRVWPANE